MKKTILLLFFVIGLLPSLFSQQSLGNITRKSHQVLVYRITADTAEKYITKGIKEIDHYLLQQPTASFRINWRDYDSLPVGNYIMLFVQDTMIEAQYWCRSSVIPFVVNNMVRPQLILRDIEGKLFTNASVWVNKAPAKFNPASSTYIIGNRKPDEAIVKIIAGTDTSFTEMEMSNEGYVSLRKQKWQRFKSTTVGKMLAWLPERIASIFQEKNSYSTSRRKRNKNMVNGKGYVLFNKPKYFPSDTIKLKAYLLNKKGKQLKKEVKVYLSYYGKNNNIDRLLTTLKPVTPGAYVYQFATGDTLPNDTRYNIRFLDNKDRLILRNFFNIEDYMLDEVTSYSVKSQDKEYYAGDTLRFSASAKDANDLPVMDGRVKLVLLTKQVSDFYNEKVFVPDTLWQEEKDLLVQEETKFRVPSDKFPNADIELTAKAIFRNSNNEIVEQTATTKYLASQNYIDVKEENGMITAVYYSKSKPTKAKGFMDTDLTIEPLPIEFPYTARIDPQTEGYEFYIEGDDGKDIAYEDFEVNNGYQVSFMRKQQLDTAGFILYNPKKIQVYYSLFDKDKEILSASSSEENIVWQERMPVGKMYHLRWQYYWSGEERTNYENVGLLSKLMSAEIGGSSIVYPGQKDTITVKLKDYMQKEVGGVNLTVASYNTQFANSIRVPEPPYIEKFRGRRPILYDEYETTDISANRSFSLGKHQGWRKIFGLDTMQYYRFLFPDSGSYMVKTRVRDLLPQLSVYAVKQGVPQEIYLLYVNRQLVDYNGVTDKSLNVVSRFPGYVQIIIRLRDKYIETDSIYLQPYYKHDIVFDLDKLGKNFKVTNTETFWSDGEKNVLNNQILRIESNYRNNNGYVWQDDKAFYLGSNSEHIVGPFINYDSIQFFKPGDFDMRFFFEPNYRYRLTPQMVRLERIPLLSLKDKIYLPLKKTSWIIGDTLKDLPVISYEKRKSGKIFLEQWGSNAYGNFYTSARMQIQLPKDSTIAFTVLYKNAADHRVMWGAVQNLYNITEGNYTLILVTKNFKYLVAKNIDVPGPGTICIKFDKPVYDNENEIVAEIIQQQVRRQEELDAKVLEKQKEENAKNNLYKSPQMNLLNGTAVVTGRIIDDKGGDPIPGVSIFLKGYRKGTVTAGDGTFRLSEIPAGKYVLVFSTVGYAPLEKEISISDGENIMENVQLKMSTARMSEVVVTALGVTRQAKELGFSSSKIAASELTQALSGKVSGLYVQSEVSGVYADSTRITLRGIRSLTANANGQPLIIVDGVILDKPLSEINPNDIANVSTLNGAEATALYGSRAANGVLIITTKGFAPKSLREEFRDYAFWKPNLITDDNGEVKFDVTYPDNITSWQTYVVGMDKKRRITKSSKLVKAFKPMLAQLSAPQFLIEGDTAFAVGKKINYTTSALNVSSQFSINGKQQSSASESLRPNESSISELMIGTSVGSDSIKAQFMMKADNGFEDGELRKIPVLRRGTIETIGQFNIMEGDTTLTVQTDQQAGMVSVFVQNNTLDLLLEEIEGLKKYPYYCMEQIASKLTGLVMEKKIREVLQQPFANEKEMQKLLERLQKGQLFDGGWGWWEGNRPNIYITNYITRALLQMRGDALLETNIRNALLFLNNQLPKLDKYELLESLYTLSEAGHDMDYDVFLKRLVFDSLDQHQQWQMLAVLQKQKLDHEKELQTLLNKKTRTMLGGLHWGAYNYWWHRNDVATTVLAYRVLDRMNGYENEKKQIVQYFLERRKTGRWQNTVESATILSSILPNMLKENSNFNKAASVNISGDTMAVVNKFPFSMSYKPHGNNLNVHKQGGGMLYFTAYQQVFNKQPEAVDSNFRIYTHFENKGTDMRQLRAGEKVKMKVEIEVLKDAEYVQIEIPIPAGCTYGTKSNNIWSEHWEYFRDKVMIFSEKMNKGKIIYEIELEPRYNGNYTLNPAKAELMYFPVFYGRNDIKKIEIVK